MKIENIEIPSCFEYEFRCPYCGFQLCPKPQEMPFCSHITFLHIRDCCDSNGFAVVKSSFARKYIQKIMESQYVKDYESDDLTTTLNVLLEKEDPLSDHCIPMYLDLLSQDLFEREAHVYQIQEVERYYPSTLTVGFEKDG